MNQKIKGKQTKRSVKSVVFWGSIIFVTLILIIVFIIAAVNNKKTTSYDEFLTNNAVSGKEIFDREEDVYLVLFHDFENKEKEDFDNSIFAYLDYIDSNEKALKLYAADVDDEFNQMCINSKPGSTDSLIEGSEYFPSPAEDNEKALLIDREELPVLIRIEKGEDNKKIVTKGCAGEEAIRRYLKELKNK